MEVIKNQEERILLMIDNDYLMSIRGKKIIFNKIGEDSDNIYLKALLMDVCLAEDFYKCVKFLTDSISKTIHISKLPYPVHNNILLINGYVLNGDYISKLDLSKEEKRR